MFEFDFINPFVGMESLRKQINDAFGTAGVTASTCTFPLVNVYDNQDDLIVVAEMPGVKKDSVNINLLENTLTISGVREKFELGEDTTVLRRERSTGPFEKSFRLPLSVDKDKISASMAEGILTVTLPKSEEAKPKQIAIKSAEEG
jgi:HSP20 family protein